MNQPIMACKSFAVLTTARGVPLATRSVTTKYRGESVSKIIRPNLYMNEITMNPCFKLDPFLSRIHATDIPALVIDCR